MESANVGVSIIGDPNVAKRVRRDTPRLIETGEDARVRGALIAGAIGRIGRIVIDVRIGDVKVCFRIDWRGIDRAGRSQDVKR